MANLMQRLLRSQSCLKANIPRLTPNLITLHEKPSCIVEPVPLTNPVITFSDSGTKTDESLRFYPSFPIGYGLNPSVVHRWGVIDTVVEEKEKEEKEKEVVIQADSVKKKRKKKMNKHKYRKLRKKQGRKS